jgi:hypothetical protein
MDNSRNRHLPPTITIAGFSIAPDEILLVGVFLLFVISRIARHTKRKPESYAKFTGARVLVALAGGFFGLGLVRGILESNPNYRNEFKLVLLPALYLVMLLSELDVSSKLSTFRKAVIFSATALATSGILYILWPAYQTLLTSLPFPEARSEYLIFVPETYNMLRFFYAWCLASCLNGDRPRGLYLTLLAISLASLLIRFDKTTYLQVPVIALLLVWFLIKEKRFVGNLVLLVASLSLIIILIFQITSVKQFIENYVEQMNYRVMRPDIAGDYSSGRFDIWNEAMSGIKANPLLGRGLGLVYYSQLSGEVKEHNMALWISSRLGIPALLIVIALLSWYVRLGLKTVHSLQTKERSFAAAMLAFSISMVVTSLTGVQIMYFEVAVLFVFSCGVVIKLNSRLRHH